MNRGQLQAADEYVAAMQSAARKMVKARGLRGVGTNSSEVEPAAVIIGQEDQLLIMQT
jgi:hypothetical protein